MQATAEGWLSQQCLAPVPGMKNACCCPLQAVELWRASVQQPEPAAADAPPDGQAAQQAAQGSGADAAVPSPEQRQRYEASLKPLAFQVGFCAQHALWCSLRLLPAMLPHHLWRAAAIPALS